MNKIKNLILVRIVNMCEHIGYLQIKGKKPFQPRVKNNGLIIRTATSERDIKEALRIHRLSPDTPPPDERLYELYRIFGKKLFFIAEKDHEVVGYCFFKVTPMISKKCISKKAFLLLLGVRSDYRNKGIASALLRDSIEILRKYGIGKVYLNVDEDNGPAMRLYTKFGFEIANKTSENECCRLEWMLG